MNISLPWMTEASRYVGLRETPGKEHNATIVNWLIHLNAWWRDDETPWCGTFVAHCFKACGITLPGAWYRAKAWANWGTPLALPVYGCVVVFERAGGGHVGLVMGRDSRGRLMVLGGNQGNAVSVAPFDRARVLGYRWPPGQPLAEVSLPLLESSAASSSNEA